jgi:hypothetical protein
MTDSSVRAARPQLELPLSSAASAAPAPYTARAITPDTALRLARYFNTTAEFWLNLQSKFDLDIAEDKMRAKIHWEVRPRKAVAINEGQNRRFRNGATRGNAR